MTIPRRCGRDDLSLLLGVSPRRVSQLVQQKVLQQETRGLFNTHDSVHKFIAWREGVIAKVHGVSA
jgi:hypothetical protein